MENLSIMKNVLKMEAEAINAAVDKIQELEVKKLIDIYQVLQRVGGSLIFCGVGKSGLIAEKLAATFTSLGIRSFSLHPVEALHGDLGLVRPEDAIIFLSKSGTTEEIMKLMPFIPVKMEMRIGLLGNISSVIADHCGVLFDCSVEKEACINNQAPTTSSTLALAMGDAMAVVYEKFVGLSKEGFAVNHPGGLLGKSLIVKVKDLMWKASKCPQVSKDAVLKDAILEMTNKPVGGCAVVEDGKLLGIMVEGDIRRTFTKENKGVETPIIDIMNPSPVFIKCDDLALEAMKMMENRENQIALLPVVEDGNFLGFIRLHDLLQEGFHVNS